MFENVSLQRSSTSRPQLSLESLEDRTTPAVVSPTGFNGVALDPISLAQAGPIDRAYLSEAARLSAVQVWLGTVTATQGSSAQIRQFGAQLAQQETQFFNAALPALTATGATIQLTSFDLQLVNAFPALTPAQLDSQFLALATLYSLQESTLAQAETVLGSSSAVRVLAQRELFVTQQELLVEATLLGSTNSVGMVNAFGLLGAFDSIGVPGLLAAGNTFGTTGFGTTGFGTTTVSSAGFGAGSTVGVGTFSGFGSGASFGLNNGFGPSSTAGFSSSGGFGPNSNFGMSGGFGPFTTNGTGM